MPAVFCDLIDCACRVRRVTPLLAIRISVPWHRRGAAAVIEQ